MKQIIRAILATLTPSEQIPCQDFRILSSVFLIEMSDLRGKELKYAK